MSKRGPVFKREPWKANPCGSEGREGQEGPGSCVQVRPIMLESERARNGSCLRAGPAASPERVEIMATKEKFYVWFDTEYSGLGIEDAVLLQVGALVTDTDLRRVLPPDRDIRLAIRLPRDAKLSPWVEENLPRLLEECRSAGAAEVADADEGLAAYVDSVVGPPAERESDRPVLAGNSVHIDWWLVRRFLPRFLSRINYRLLDVSGLKLEWMNLFPGSKFEKEMPDMVQRYFPEAVLPGSEARHDAYYDVQASIAELAFYRRHLFQQF